MTDPEYLKKSREKFGLSASEMAEKMGYSHRSAIYQIEKGQKNLSNQARKLLDCLNSK